MDLKQLKIKKHFEARKDTTKKVFDKFLKQLEPARCIFDFSSALNSTLFVRKEQVYKSRHKGESDWSYPKKETYNFNNYLVGIVKNDQQFNFVFKNGDKSNAPMNGQEEPVISINPSESVIRKVIVNYHPSYNVYGFKLFDKADKCVLEIGSFDYTNKEIFLSSDERIIGFESRLYSANYAQHNDLVFVIARRDD